jgi:hypothetical protein
LLQLARESPSPNSKNKEAQSTYNRRVEVRLSQVSSSRDRQFLHHNIYTENMASWWPSWKRKAPILHRALAAGDHDALEGEQPPTQSLLSIEELATKRRVRKRDQLQRNALHIAVCSSRSFSTILLLRLSLSHRAPSLFRSQCMNQPPLEVVHMLIELYPKAVEEHDKIGRLPLHLACSHQASLDVIDYLVQKYPAAIVELSDRGVGCFCPFCFFHKSDSFSSHSFDISVETDDALILCRGK